MTELDVQNLIVQAVEAQGGVSGAFEWVVPGGAFGINRIRVVIGDTPTRMGRVITAFPIEGPSVIKYQREIHRFFDGAGNLL